MVGYLDTWIPMLFVTPSPLLSKNDDMARYFLCEWNEQVYHR